MQLSSARWCMLRHMCKVCAGCACWQGSKLGTAAAAASVAAAEQQVAGRRNPDCMLLHPGLHFRALLNKLLAMLTEPRRLPWSNMSSKVRLSERQVASSARPFGVDRAASTAPSLVVAMSSFAIAGFTASAADAALMSLMTLPALPAAAQPGTYAGASGFRTFI